MSNTETRREREEMRLRELLARRPKDDSDFNFQGVLLSDAIKKCCESFDLIAPLREQNLKPANYKLRIGDEYAIRGKIHQLLDQPGKNEITIEPFEVAVIKTLETINMPPFLIARWNIQVSKAYQGLLWVGGPQVDAGYVGNLFCPIYNLSDKVVILRYGDPIAVIDFEKTSHVTRNSKLYQGGQLPERVLFQDYEPETLQSGLATGVRDEIKNFRNQLSSLNSRMDIFVGITFALLGILYAAGTLFLMRPDHPLWWNTGVWGTSALAIFISSWALARSRSGQPKAAKIIVWVLLFVLVGASLSWQSHLQNQINQIQTSRGNRSTPQ
jgi:deoxycytidine triphosphate deaminase